MNPEKGLTHAVLAFNQLYEHWIYGHDKPKTHVSTSLNKTCPSLLVPVSQD